MESKVIVLTPNGRRQNIKVSPNTTILQILEEACRKHGFESENYCLRHHNREVGLTQIFRFSGLPNNCLLEMMECAKRRIAEPVDICIQLEDGSRQLAQFEAHESLWNVIEKLAPNAVSFENPVILYMRQEICGKEALMERTLKSLGIFEGRALLRLLDKRPEELKIQANIYKPPTEREKTEEASDSVARNVSKNFGSGGGSGGGFSITKDLVKALKTNSEVVVAQAVEQSSPNEKGNENNGENNEENKPKYDWGSGKGHSMQNKANDDDDDNEQKENEATAMELEPEYTIIGERSAILYSLDSVNRRIEELPDSFYDLTVNDLKLVLRDLQRISTGNQDAPLMTEKLRELEQQKTMLNKIAQYKNCIIRIQFPDRFVLQGVFKPSDTVYNIITFVKTFLRNPNVAFSLFTIPPKTILPLHKNLLELDLIPTALVHFALDEPSNPDDHQNILKPEFLNQLTSIEGALFAANKLRVKQRSRTTSRNEDDEQPGPSTGAIPKRSRSNNSPT